MKSLWDFSLEVYARDGVADALLALQRRRGADVNLLLYCAWHAVSGRGAASVQRLRELDAHLAPWRDAVILPLREVRERIKRVPELAAPQGAAAVREQVLGAELAAEQVAQWQLESLTTAAPAEVAPAQRRRDAEAGLRAYLGAPGEGTEEADWEDLLVLIGAL